MGNIENFDPFQILNVCARACCWGSHLPCNDAAAASGRAECKLCCCFVSLAAASWLTRCCPCPCRSCSIICPQVPLDATEQDIKKAYRKLSLLVRAALAARTSLDVATPLSLMPLQLVGVLCIAARHSPQR